MIYLNSAGTYRVIGEDLELLIYVVGMAPTLRIVSGIRLNDFVTNGKVIQLKEESVEIQRILLNPEKFCFIKTEFSTSANNKAKSGGLKGVKLPYYTEGQFEEFVDHYIANKDIPGRGKNSTVAFIMEETGWTVAQSNCVILQIIKYLKHHEARLQ